MINNCRCFCFDELDTFPDNDFASIGQLAISVDRKHIFFDENCHCHDYYELAYIRCGDGIQIINGVSYSVTQGDVFLFRLDDVHTYYSFNNMEVVNCCIKPKLLPILEEGDLFNTTVFHLTGETRTEFETLLSMLHRECTVKPEYAEEAALHYLQLMILFLKRNCTLRNTEAQRWNDLFLYLSQNYSTATLEQASTRMHMTKNYFCRIFRRKTGSTFITYINHIKLNAAIEMIRYSDTAISEIWQKVGFRQAKQFYALFKQEIGFTPIQFRKQYRTDA